MIFWKARLNRRTVPKLAISPLGWNAAIWIADLQDQPCNCRSVPQDDTRDKKVSDILRHLPEAEKIKMGGRR